jgi:hypothetical protein
MVISARIYVTSAFQLAWVGDKVNRAELKSSNKNGTLSAREREKIRRVACANTSNTFQPILELVMSYE